MPAVVIGPTVAIIGLSLAANAIGDLRVRPGSRIIVSLELEDMKVEQMMMVWAVTHRFGESKHFMDLTLVGGAEFVE